MAVFPEPRLRSGHLWAGLRVGLLGGSFNPAHDGHRTMSLYALARLRLDAVWWLVSPQNPLKPRAGMAALAERVAEAAKVARHPRIVVTSIECELDTTYTAEALAALHARFSRTRFVWLMGADNLRQIPRWRDWTRIFDTTPVAVFRRPPYCFKALGGKAAQRYRRHRLPGPHVRTLARRRPPAWVLLENPWHPASATEIRRRRRGDGSDVMSKSP